MTERSSDHGGLFESSASGPIAERAPELRADIFVLAPDQTRRKSVVATLPDVISVQAFSELDPFTQALTGSVAVVLLSTNQSDQHLQAAGQRTVQKTNYARIGLLTSDRERIKETSVPFDEIFYKNTDKQIFQDRVKRLYVRAYYEAALQRYFKISVSIQNRRGMLNDQRVESDERLQKMETSLELMKSHLQRFRQYLQPGDLEEIKTRRGSIEQMLSELDEDHDPTAIDHPPRCPNCGLAWDEWHGHDLESGREKIGADTWRCTRCGTVIGGNEPGNYRIG